VYREFYGLEEKPFALLPDPRFMYLGSSHREALAHLLYGIEAGEGFIELVGQVGTGKTTLCRTLLDRFGPEIQVAFMFNPSQSELELLQSINRELKLDTEGKGRSELVQELNEFLLKSRAEGRRSVLVVDEAQNLPRDVLEQLRLLSNLETEREKLLQIVLIGQPELEENLARTDLRQLRQRITVRWDINPLDRAETEEYVNHRLRVAGRRRGDALFTAGALRAIYAISKGTPRLINAIADRALLAGYALGRDRISTSIVRLAIREMVPMTDRRRRLWPWVVGTLAAGVGAAVLVWSAVQAGWVQSQPVEPVAAAARASGFSAIAVKKPNDGLGRLAPALQARPAERTAADALRRILQLWDISAEIPKTVEPTSMGAVLMGASNLRLSPDFTTLAEIRALDQPVILELEPRPGEIRYAVLQTLLDGELAGVAVGDELFVLGQGALNRFWTGRAIFAWRNYQSWPTLTAGDARGGVREVQAALTRLGYMNPGDPSGEYDERTEAAARKFQKDQGLAESGQFNFKTMIALYRALDERAIREDGQPLYGGPRLARTGARVRS
jgi:general secretion pathway protein A